jgi:8-oxo-dGTP pyrophosphatase MutT (NUDIX family)
VNSAATEPILRVGARALLIDPDDRLLLINEVDDEVGQPYWLTPGGGVEPGESSPAAAVREVYEETGIRIELADDCPAIYTDRRLWSYRGVRYDQTNHFFTARIVESVRAVPAALTEMERATLIAMRWWSVAELRASSDVFYPPDIADLLERVLAQRDGPVGSLA